MAMQILQFYWQVILRMCYIPNAYIGNLWLASSLQGGILYFNELWTVFYMWPACAGCSHIIFLKYLITNWIHAFFQRNNFCTLAAVCSVLKFKGSLNELATLRGRNCHVHSIHIAEAEVVALTSHTFIMACHNYKRKNVIQNIYPCHVIVQKEYWILEGLCSCSGW
jgi:hypothetical protein